MKDGISRQMGVERILHRTGSVHQKQCPMIRKLDELTNVVPMLAEITDVEPCMSRRTWGMKPYTQFAEENDFLKRPKPDRRPQPPPSAPLKSKLRHHEGRGLRFALGVEAGMTPSNGSSVDDSPNHPFGGENNSGMGRFGGEWVEGFTADHWVTVQHTPHPYPS